MSEPSATKPTRTPRPVLTIDELPEQVRRLEGGLQVTWIQMFNAKRLDGFDEEGAAAAAWEVVKLARQQSMGDLARGFELNGNGRLLIFPRGTFRHPEYGTLDFDDEFFAEIKRNFDAKVLGQTQPFVDLDHDHGAAAGWIKSLSIEDEGLWGVVSWTSLGETMIRSQQYRYFSPWFGPYENAETGKKYDRVLRGGGLTNVPFLKVLPGVALSELVPWRRPAIDLDAVVTALAELRQEANDMNDDPSELYAKLLREECAKGRSLHEAFEAIRHRTPGLSSRCANQMAIRSGSPWCFPEREPATHRNDGQADPGQQLAELVERRAGERHLPHPEALAQVTAERPELVTAYVSARG